MKAALSTTNYDTIHPDTKTNTYNPRCSVGAVDLPRANVRVNLVELEG